MSFKIDDRVEAMDDTITGVIKEMKGDKITVLSDDGFLLIYQPSELIKIIDDRNLTVSNFEIAKIKSEKAIPKKRNSQLVKPKERSAPKMEVDLHIHNLVPSQRGMSNYDMLNIQLDTAKRQLEFAIRKKIQKVVFIHGVGQGVLKEELQYLFGRYDAVKYYDADYQKYGLGATEIYIYQNS
ncbi:Smr/MutS family protein [Cellulophaga sp. HaHa_2_95]|uniref:Smr/MutS family protein n=1 Tax=unclassified Cellulophaga TaxID=2634405 RepID=UPI001C4EAA81|nr:MULTISPECIES: Smr/MutS family protein [unclassified Cellulophaga]QXP52061.1 Smr/MutS family protein [Cellulophaga sp. HaHa_2_1]QXP55613.1 Smr/MutS family protein [Cellulophaga sp. HaHa_2_95]